MANQVCGPRMLLDCTLRDGGYVNNWEFEEDTVRKVVRALYEAGVRYIELGILGQGRQNRAGVRSFRILFRLSRIWRRAIQTAGTRLC